MEIVSKIHFCLSSPILCQAAGGLGHILQTLVDRTMARSECEKLTATHDCGPISHIYHLSKTGLNIELKSNSFQVAISTSSPPQHFIASLAIFTKL